MKVLTEKFLALLVVELTVLAVLVIAESSAVWSMAKERKGRA